MRIGKNDNTPLKTMELMIKLEDKWYVSNASGSSYLGVLNNTELMKHSLFTGIESEENEIPRSDANHLVVKFERSQNGSWKCTNNPQKIMEI